MQNDPRVLADLRKAAEIITLPSGPASGVPSWADRHWASTLIHNSGLTILDLLDRLELAEARLRTPNASWPPLNPDGPHRKMLIEIQVSADFEKRLDNQWEVEREINADRWSWKWADESRNVT